MERDKNNEPLGTARNRQTLRETRLRKTDRVWIDRKRERESESGKEIDRDRERDRKRM